MNDRELYGSRIRVGSLIFFMTFALALAFAPLAMANSITGDLAIGGTNMHSLTGITFNNPAVIFLATGSLAVMSSVPTLTLNNITFATATGESLFDWNHGGTDIKMTLLNLTVEKNSPRFLNVKGTATLTQSGFSPTKYDYSLASTATGVTSYALTLSTVPEPGTLGLLGTGVLGLAAMIRRKITT
jgi:hypothetical protein